MNRTKPIELTNLCLIYDEDRILVQEREWRGEKGIIFPGGHVEDGESLLEAVVREIESLQRRTEIIPGGESILGDKETVSNDARDLEYAGAAADSGFRSIQ